MNTPQEILSFWFGEPRGKRQKAWFEKSPAFDADVRARFLRPYGVVAGGDDAALAPWKNAATDALALIVLTDQLPRNMFRGTPQAFASDPVALAAAKHCVASGWDAQMLPVERMFLYLPLEHSEVLADQVRAMELFEPLNAYPETVGTPEYARRHWEIILRFGRFPHRNAILGRTNTPEEAEFLKQPGSGF